MPDKPELKIREYEIFRGYYCGVCKSIKNNYGQIPRFTLTYDSSFLALLLDSMSKKEVNISIERCIAHPVNKRKVIKNSIFVDYASDMNIILAYLKVKDDWNDERKIYAFPAMLALKKAYKKVYKKYNEKCSRISDSLKKLNDLEKRKSSSLDEVSILFGKVMEEVTDCPYIEDDNQRKALKWIGYNIGRWIYILDAYDDIEKDIKNKSYNPLIYQYEYNNQSLNDFKAEIVKDIDFLLVFILSEIEKGFNLIDVYKNKEIVENIIYLGMLKKTEAIIKGSGKDEKSV